MTVDAERLAVWLTFHQWPTEAETPEQRWAQLAESSRERAVQQAVDALRYATHFRGAAA